MNQRLPLDVDAWWGVEEAVVGESIADLRPPCLGRLRVASHLVEKFEDGGLDVEGPARGSQRKPQRRGWNRLTWIES